MPSEDQDLYTTATLASMEAGTDQARADVVQLFIIEWVKEVRVQLKLLLPVVSLQ